MATLEVPDAAMPVVEVLRRDVPKPEVESLTYFNCPRFLVPVNPTPFTKPCAMGLHPASESVPYTAAEFGNLATSQAVTAFGRWWDSLAREQAKAALHLIWGED